MEGIWVIGIVDWRSSWVKFEKEKHVPTPGIEPGPPGWKPGILTTGLYGIHESVYVCNRVVVWMVSAMLRSVKFWRDTKNWAVYFSGPLKKRYFLLDQPWTRSCSMNQWMTRSCLLDQWMVTILIDQWMTTIGISHQWTTTILFIHQIDYHDSLFRPIIYDAWLFSF